MSTDFCVKRIPAISDDEECQYWQGQQHNYHKKNSYTVWSLYRIWDYKIEHCKYREFRIKKNNITRQTLVKIVECVDASKNENSSFSYICPICGANNLIVDEVPFYFGDDYRCRCRRCRNTFVFGGTRPIDFKYTSLAELSPDPHALAYRAMLAECKIIAKREQKSICYFDDIVLIMEELGEEYQITEFMKLCR